MGTGTVSSLSIAPVLPWWALALCGCIALVLLFRSAVQKRRGGLLRLLAFAALLGGLITPHHEKEQREQQNDIALVLVDRSASLSVGTRSIQRDDAVMALKENLEQLDADLDVRFVDFGAVKGGLDSQDGTMLVEALSAAVADIPADRYAGAVVITDGQIHDLPKDAVHDALLPEGVLHVLLAGQRDTFDRRIVIDRVPGYGLVGQETSVAFHVSETSENPNQKGHIPVSFKVNGLVRGQQVVQPGEKSTFRFVLDHAGTSVVEVVAEPAVDELSVINNTGVATINGVRDRLRVLLVSGQPHAGERTWRNLLKSDPAVDLVHFTILRPPQKSDFTPIHELALITFPTFELFDTKINDFDLMVFDRYVVRYVLSSRYFRNIEQYVRDGGGLLVVVGPEYAGHQSLNETALGGIMPVSPTGAVLEQGFHPRLSEQGRLHPVTRVLSTADQNGDETPHWGRWFRQVESTYNRGSVLMEGINDQPLLLLDTEGDGRVGMMTSDHIWLWARGFEGGGPQTELLRRVAHWLMKEPGLEAERLDARLSTDHLAIERWSMGELPPHVVITGPDGGEATVSLEIERPGKAVGHYPVNLPGVYRVQDRALSSLVPVGAMNPLEYNDLTASEKVLKPYTNASGGGIWWLNETMPGLRRTKPGRDQAGRDWMGLQANKSYVVTGLERTALFPGWLTACLVSGLLLGAWWREGR